MRLSAGVVHDRCVGIDDCAHRHFGYALRSDRLSLILAGAKAYAVSRRPNVRWHPIARALKSYKRMARPLGLATMRRRRHRPVLCAASDALPNPRPAGEQLRQFSEVQGGARRCGYEKRRYLIAIEPGVSDCQPPPSALKAATAARVDSVCACARASAARNKLSSACRTSIRLTAPVW